MGMQHVRLGIIGLGVMGQGHARNIRAGKVPGLRLAAVADSDPARLADFADLPRFDSAARFARKKRLAT